MTASIWNISLQVHVWFVAVSCTENGKFSMEVLATNEWRNIIWYLQLAKDKDKVHPRTGHEGPQGE